MGLAMPVKYIPYFKGMTAIAMGLQTLVTSLRLDAIREVVPVTPVMPGERGLIEVVFAKPVLGATSRKTVEPLVGLTVEYRVEAPDRAIVTVLNPQAPKAEQYGSELFCDIDELLGYLKSVTPRLFRLYDKYATPLKTLEEQGDILLTETEILVSNEKTLLATYTLVNRVMAGLRLHSLQAEYSPRELTLVMPPVFGESPGTIEPTPDLKLDYRFDPGTRTAKTRILKPTLPCTATRNDKCYSTLDDSLRYMRKLVVALVELTKLFPV